MTSPNAQTESLPDPVLHQVERLVGEIFPEAAEGPILGMTDRDIVAPSLHELLQDPDTTVATIERDGAVAGFSLAVPIGHMDPRRVSESGETAYIYFTGISSEHQGMGLVAPLMDQMIEKLRAAGYGHMERDCVLEGGYADNVEKSYQGSIEEQYDHERWPGMGPERFFRIDLSKLPPSVPSSDLG